jgi:DNA repair protein RadC
MRIGPLVESPQLLRDWLRMHCAALEHQVPVAIDLDARHARIDTEQLFRGRLTQTSVYPREVVHEIADAHLQVQFSGASNDAQSLNGSLA